MKTHEVKRPDWQLLCQRINQDCRGALIKIQHVRPDGTSEAIVDGLPLQSLALDEVSDGCNDLLVIEAGLPEGKPVRHVITEPIHVRLKNGDNDRYNRVEIQAEDGLTLLSLNPGIKALPASGP